MLKKLFAIGLGASLILAPVVAMAQTTPAPEATPGAAAPEKPMAEKPMKKHVTKKHTVKKHHTAKKPMAEPAPSATEEPKS